MIHESDWQEPIDPETWLVGFRLVGQTYRNNINAISCRMLRWLPFEAFAIGEVSEVCADSQRGLAYATVEFSANLDASTSLTVEQWNLVHAEDAEHWSASKRTATLETTYQISRWRDEKNGECTCVAVMYVRDPSRLNGLVDEVLRTGRLPVEDLPDEHGYVE